MPNQEPSVKDVAPCETAESLVRLHLRTKDNALKECGDTEEPQGDRYHGYSIGYEETKYTFPSGMVLKVTHYDEPGDMFTSGDRWTMARLYGPDGVLVDSEEI